MRKRTAKNDFSPLLLVGYEVLEYAWALGAQKGLRAKEDKRRSSTRGHLVEQTDRPHGAFAAQMESDDLCVQDHWQRTLVARLTRQ